MKIAHVDNQGKLLGWYTKEIHPLIPTPNIEVTEEAWQAAIDGNHNKVNSNGQTEVFDFRTAEEKAMDLEDAKPKEVSMAQFRAALILLGLKAAVDTAVHNSDDELLISDYEYRVTVRRDWPSFSAMATALGKTETEIDSLFLLASTL